ncbi:GntR family transcriptional regulator [Chelativorans sp. M5D2P16]|uniref:GntR family transcriptional regulator n=1 Tax=Chelativorans sp. M5D2P16 TaxID=3095678 RepID=UPI002ACA6298|nr:GntR family transcriptional regulator [Chelativorans sp. M5D2P16]MDZ5697455.1 GntR family transcriptional regulator [Chelativorans sp. M5D2P16]
MILSEQIKEELLDDILSGKYEPGDRLVESQIARALGVSQSPVREALRDLVAMKFVEVVPYKGARVRRVDPREVVEIYPVRARLEELAGQLAFRTIGASINELEDVLANMRKAVEAGDAREVAARDVDFHRIIIDASENQVLIDTWNSLMIEARTFVTARNLLNSPDKFQSIPDAHRPIIDALKTGDPNVFGRVMREHVEAFGAIMVEVYSNDAENHRSVDAGSQRHETVPGN